MDVEYKIVDRCLIMAIGNELDHHEAKKIKVITDQVLRKGKVKHVVLDFEQTSFMDSSGIGMIISRYKEVNLRGGKVSIINASAAVKKLIRISGLHKLVYEYCDLNEALMNL